MLKLNDFTIKALSPIIEQDKVDKTQFTKTLVLLLVYQLLFLVDKILYIHVNTVHYRVNRAKELLNIDHKTPEN